MALTPTVHPARTPGKPRVTPAVERNRFAEKICGAVFAFPSGHTDS